MKKLALLTLPILSVALLAGCAGSLNNTGTATAGGSTGSENTLIHKDEAMGVIAYQAATSVGMLSNLNSVNNALRMAPAPQTTIDTIMDYLPSVEAALLGDEILSSATITAGQREGYAHTMSIVYKDMNLVENSLAIHYNETQIIDHDDDDDDDDEFEEEFRIEGLVVIGEAEYPMIGERETELDESEISFTYFLTEDRTTRVEVSHETEALENEFEYKLIQNGRTVYEYSVEAEVNDEVELFVKDVNGNVELEMEFEFLNRDGVTYLVATIGDDDDPSASRITFLKGETGYSVVENV